MFINQKVLSLNLSFHCRVRLDVPQPFLWSHLLPEVFFCRLTWLRLLLSIIYVFLLQFSASLRSAICRPLSCHTFTEVINNLAGQRSLTIKRLYTFNVMVVKHYLAIIVRVHYAFFVLIAVF